MGLKERRAVQEFEQNEFPKLKQEITTTTGFDVDFDVQWEKLAVDGYDHMYTEAFTKVYFTPIINAFKAICVDDMGKEALKGTLKKITLTNEQGVYGATGMSFDGGNLTIDHKPASNIDDIKLRSEALQKILEDSL